MWTVMLLISVLKKVHETVCRWFLGEIEETAMKKIMYKLVLAAMSCILISGCSVFSGESQIHEESLVQESQIHESQIQEPQIQETDGDAVIDMEGETPDVLESEEETADSVQEPLIENNANNEDGHHVFNPHMFSTRYFEEFGEETRDALFALCDAIRAGEDSFACPDQNTYDWCLGRLATEFCPVARLYCTKYSPDGSPSFENGRGHIFYTIPKEEVVKKQKAFEDRIVAILDDCVSDDYNDFEKTLALYEHMCENYLYDYDMNEVSLERMDDQSPYRCLMEGMGICNEIARLYNILLLQVGVDSDPISGPVYYSDGTVDGHAWVYVTLDGISYHIDPTWGITDGHSTLAYFLMDDQTRSERDNCPVEFYSLGAKGDESRQFFDFAAEDNRYASLWEGYYIGMDREAQDIVYYDEEGNRLRFHYGKDQDNSDANIAIS